MTIAQSALSFYVATPGGWSADWAWGVPLIVFYCDACGTQLKDYGFMFRTQPEPLRTQAETGRANPGTSDASGASYWA